MKHVFRLVLFAAAPILLVGGMAVSICLLVKAQEACRRAAAHCRLARTAQGALGRMARHFPEAGNVDVSADGLTVTFQLPIPLTMPRLWQCVAHGGAPPAPGKVSWAARDVNQDGKIDGSDVDTRDAHGRTFWGAREAVGDVWGNFMCYQFRHLDANENGRVDAEDCIDESVVGMDLNRNGRMDETFLPGELFLFSTTEGEADGHPEESMTSLCEPLITGRNWVIVRWDREAGRVALPGEQDVDGDGEADGPIFRDMIQWPSKPLDHPLRKPPDGSPGLWDVWKDCPRVQYRQGSTILVDIWQLKITIDGRHFLQHVRTAFRRERV